MSVHYKTFKDDKNYVMYFCDNKVGSMDDQSAAMENLELYAKNTLVRAIARLEDKVNA